MKSIIILGIMSLLAGCAQGERASISLLNWSFFMPEQVLVDFYNQTGIRVDLSTFDSNEEMYSRLRTASSLYDVAVPSGDFIPLLIEQALLLPLNRSLLPNFHNIDRTVLGLLSFDPGNRYSVPYAMGATGLNINRRYVQDFEPSWGLMGDERFRGRIAKINDARHGLGAALKYLGYSANSINENEINTARDQYKIWLENMTRYNLADVGEAFAREEIVIAHSFPEFILNIIQDNNHVLDQYHFVIPREGGLIFIDNMVILRSTQRVQESHKFINYILNPVVHGYIMDEYWYPSLISAANRFRSRMPPYTIMQLLNNYYEFRLDVGSARYYYDRAWSEILSVFDN